MILICEESKICLFDKRVHVSQRFISIIDIPFISVWLILINEKLFIKTKLWKKLIKKYKVQKMIFYIIYNIFDNRCSR